MRQHWFAVKGRPANVCTSTLSRTSMARIYTASIPLRRLISTVAGDAKNASSARTASGWVDVAASPAEIKRRNGMEAV